MPLKVSIKLGDDVFEAEGDFSFDDGFSAVFRQWINAIDETPGQLESIADTINTQSDALDAAVRANTPTE